MCFDSKNSMNNRIRKVLNLLHYSKKVCRKKIRTKLIIAIQKLVTLQMQMYIKKRKLH